MTTQKTTNDVTLFSNGIGHFRRVYKISRDKESNFSIPFKRDHIGDVAASLQVFGKVRLTKPPSFTPSNANATSLHINQNNALKSLLSNLSGAQVKVRYTNSTEKSYTLLGLEIENEAQHGGVTERPYIVLMSGGSVKRKSLNDIEDIHFEEEGVRTEIDKALKNNFQMIKPDSTLMDLSLRSLDDSDTEAVVQYTIPVAAWKMRYAVRQEGDAFTLEGAAIIDNNTDEDWDNFRVSVVTGNPISFNTDIATVCVPHRKTIKLVDGNVLGNVEVNEAYSMQQMASGSSALEACGFGAAQVAASRGLMSKQLCTPSFGPKMSMSNSSQYGINAEESWAESVGMAGAESAGVDSKEVGDFCVFTSREPITILARKSAVVPMFTVTLAKAGVVLLYKESNHARRPYRAVKFKNETEYSLGKGKTIIYQSGTFSGECVLDSTKPGENRMLPHCLENGVKVSKAMLPTETKRTALRLSEGVGVTEEVHTAVSTYEIENKKDEKFKIAVEHVKTLGTSPTVNMAFELSEGLEMKDQEKLADNSGYRVYFELAPKQKLTLTAMETMLSSHTTRIDANLRWVSINIVSVKNPLASDKSVLASIKVQEQIDEVETRLAEVRIRRAELTQQSDRVRQNLASAKDVGNKKTVDEWVADLDTTEKEIRVLETKTMPELTKKVKDLQSNLSEALKKISANWKA